MRLLPSREIQNGALDKSLGCLLGLAEGLARTPCRIDIDGVRGCVASTGRQRWRSGLPSHREGCVKSYGFADGAGAEHGAHHRAAIHDFRHTKRNDEGLNSHYPTIMKGRAFDF